MANKQIKDYANTALADTDSLIKQSVAGLTAKTTLADVKTDLDGRYQRPPQLIYQDLSDEAPWGAEISPAPPAGILILGLSSRCSTGTNSVRGLQYIEIYFDRRPTTTLFPCTTAFWDSEDTRAISTTWEIGYAEAQDLLHIGKFVGPAEALIKVKEVYKV